MTLPPLRYLSAADIVASMPPVEERLHLAELTLVALADGSAELPAKIAIHPRGASSFGHAMPAHLRGTDPTGHDDLVGMKWVVGYPANGAPGGPGLPTIFATIVMNDASTGLPVAILDGGPITAARTAAISGVALRRFARTSARLPGGATGWDSSAQECRVGVISRSSATFSRAPICGSSTAIMRAPRPL